MNQYDRRKRILETLSFKKKATLSSLATTLNVSRRTIMNDIDVLSMTYPIRTVAGQNGGIFVDKDWQYEEPYLSTEQLKFLHKFLESPRNSKSDKKIAESIIIKFSAP